MTRVQPVCLPFRITAALGSTLLLIVLAGCGVTGSNPPGMALQNVALSGIVHGGQQPLTQSNIALYATSSAGYGGTLSPLATATTGTSGSFTITSSITCPADPTAQAYIVSTGGNPGLASGSNNSAIFLVAALGPCRSLS